MPNTSTFAQQTTITSHTITLPSQRVHYLAAGNPTAPPLLLVHGYSALADVWRLNIDAFSQQFYVIAPDLGGYGQSDKPFRVYTLSYQTRLLRQLIDALELPRITLVANSMGGTIALMLAEQQPKRIRALVLASPFGVGVRWRLKFRDLFRYRIWPNILNRLFGVTQHNFEQMLRLIVHNLDRLPPKIRDKSMYRFWKPSGYPRIMTGIGLLSQMGTPLHRWHFLRRIRQLPHSTLILWGENDILLPVEWAYNLHDTLPNAQLHIFPNCGHVSMLEIPDEFNRETLAFLQQMIV